MKELKAEEFNPPKGTGENFRKLYDEASEKFIRRAAEFLSQKETASEFELVLDQVTAFTYVWLSEVNYGFQFNVKQSDAHLEEIRSVVEAICEELGNEELQNYYDENY